MSGALPEQSPSRLEGLVSALFDESLAPQEAKELNALLATDSEARRAISAPWIRSSRSATSSALVLMF